MSQVETGSTELQQGSRRQQRQGPHDDFIMRAITMPARFGVAGKRCSSIMWWISAQPSKPSRLSARLVETRLGGSRQTAGLFDTGAREMVEVNHWVMILNLSI